MRGHGPSETDTCVLCERNFASIEKFHIRLNPAYIPGNVPYIPCKTSDKLIHNCTSPPDCFKCMFCFHGVRPETTCEWKPCFETSTIVATIVDHGMFHCFRVCKQRGQFIVDKKVYYTMYSKTQVHTVRTAKKLFQRGLFGDNRFAASRVTQTPFASISTIFPVR